MDSPYLRRMASAAVGESGRKAEKHIARRIKGELTPASGAMGSSKGDIRKTTNTHPLLVENKTTTGASFGVKQDYLLKIYQEALEVNRTPVLSFQFVREDGKSEKRDRWVCIPEHIFFEMLDVDEYKS